MVGSTGPVITISIEPDIDFNDRSGMSNRARAIELWHTDIPEGDVIMGKCANMLMGKWENGIVGAACVRPIFCVDNPPGTKYVSGSQDSLQSPGRCSHWIMAVYIGQRPGFLWIKFQLII